MFVFRFKKFIIFRGDKVVFQIVQKIAGYETNDILRETLQII